MVLSVFIRLSNRGKANALKFQSVLTYAGTLGNQRVESLPKISKIKIHGPVLLNPFSLGMGRGGYENECALNSINRTLLKFRPKHNLDLR